MTNTRLIIVLEGGVVKAVHANKDLGYVVVDLDIQTTNHKCLIMQPMVADFVDPDLSLRELSERDVPQISQEPTAKSHPWWKKSV